MSYKAKSAPSKDAAISAGLRRAFFRSAAYKSFMSKQVVKWVGRKRFYSCACCQEFHVKSKLDLDHIIPVVDPERGRGTWDEYIERLWCEEDNLQLLCKTCHKAKTKAEGQIRTAARRFRQNAAQPADTTTTSTK